MRKKWADYENAARQLLGDLRAALGAATAGGRQVVGASGAQWELDARAWQDGPDGFLLIEAQQYASPLKREALANLAWRIEAAGTAGGAAALLLQEAPGVAATAGVEYMRLTDDSTAENYLAEFLFRRFPAVS